MGVIRKTLSISTLGLVGWQSKKERLREAEAALEATRHDLEKTSRKESILKERLLAAERRAEAAELDAIHDSKVARRRGARRVKLDEAVETTKRRGQSVRDMAEAGAAELQARTAKARRKAAKQTRKSRRRQLAAVADEAAASVRAKAKALTPS